MRVVVFVLLLLLQGCFLNVSNDSDSTESSSKVNDVPKAAATVPVKEDIKVEQQDEQKPNVEAAPVIIDEEKEEVIVEVPTMMEKLVSSPSQVVSIGESVYSKMEFEMKTGNKISKHFLDKKYDGSLEGSNPITRYLRKKILLNMFKRTNDINHKSTVLFDDLHIKYVSWNDDNAYYQKVNEIKEARESSNTTLVKSSGVVKYELNLEFFGSKNTSVIKDVKIDSYIVSNDMKLNPLSPVYVGKSNGDNQSFELVEKEGFSISDNSFTIERGLKSPHSIKNNILNRSQIAAKVDDCKIENGVGDTVLCSDLQKEIRSKYATLVISTPDADEVIYVDPAQFQTFTEFLKSKDDLLEVQDARILLYRGLASNLSNSIYWDTISKEELNKGMWLTLSDDLKKIDDPIERGDLLILSYAKVSEIRSALNSFKYTKSISDFGKVSSFVQKHNRVYSISENLSTEDEVTFVFSSPRIRRASFRNYSSNVKQWDVQRYCSKTAQKCVEYEEVFSGGCSGDDAEMGLCKVSFVCVKHESYCASYANRDINKSQCKANYVSDSYKESSITLDNSNLDSLIQDIFISNGGETISISKMTSNNFLSLDYIMNKDSRAIGILKLKVTREILHLMSSGGLKVKVIDSDRNFINKLIGYQGNSCKASKRTSFATKNANKSFLEDNFYNVDIYVNSRN